MAPPPIIVTEDTPPDMLAGSMDLTVVLPNNHSLKMSVERSTPMMDLLVQVTTANKMSPAGYIIKPLNERGRLPYKPSTPIGSLDAWTIHIVPKQNVQCTATKTNKALNQPFEQTFRLQVHLPRNQLYVTRVSPKTRLADIVRQVCSEKNLDPLKYSLRHPNNLDKVLRLSCSLADYKLQEVTLVCNQSHPVEVSTVDIMSLQRETSNPAYRNTMGEGSVSSGSLEGRSLSPVPSDESSASPPLPIPPSRPTRKRRPAPKPPITTQKSLIEERQNGIPSSTAFHSRNSSDSSGYHEASVLSESPQNNRVPDPRRKMASVSEAPLSQSMTDIAVIEPSLQQATSYNSISSLPSTTGRKKKTAPPPPLTINNRASSLIEDQQRTPSISSTASSTTTLDGNDKNVTVKSATLPPSSRLNSVPKELSPPSSPFPTTKVDVESPATAKAPAPRPRSKLLSGSERDSWHCDPEETPENTEFLLKKLPAPQPRPRTLLSSNSVENDCFDDKLDLSSEITTTKHQEFMNKKLPLSVFKTHKACVDELVFKFVKKSSINNLHSSVEMENQDTIEDRQQHSLSEQPFSEPSPTSGGVKSLSITNKNQSENCFESSQEHLKSNWEAVHQSKSIVNVNAVEEREGQTPIEESQRQSDASTLGPGSPAWVLEAKTGPVEENLDVRMADEEIDRIFTNATENHSSLESGMEKDQTLSLPTLLPPPSLLTQSEPQNPSQSEDPLDWEYRLPAPPTFRDETKSPTVTEFETVTIGNFSEVHCLSDSVEEKIVNKTDLQTPLDHKENTKERIEIQDCLKRKPVDSKIQDSTFIVEQVVLPTVPSRSMLSGYDESSEKCNEAKKCIEQNMINELTNVIQRPIKVDVNDIENKQANEELTSSSTLENFTITTYKDTKPVEVFEDDSIKSSVGEKRDKSKDDAVFRAPKPRVKEPNLSRTSSFTMENKLHGPLVKRSVSYVSLLAANMPRTSQPYRAHLLLQDVTSKARQDSWPQLRKTTSEVNIDNKGEKTRDASFWQDDLQSVQVLRNILSQSQATLTSSFEDSSTLPTQLSDPPTSAQRFDNTLNNENKWGRSQSEETPTERTTKTKVVHSQSLDQETSKHVTPSYRGPPAINLSTWSERPKRQVSIINDNDYTSGFGKKSVLQDEGRTEDQLSKDIISPPKAVHSTDNSVRVDVIIKNDGFKLEGRSKSVNDLSRIPIVRAVELKKPLGMQMYDRTSLKPVHLLENENSFSKPTNLPPNDPNNIDDSFIGVNSLARRFGLPYKRPASMYVSSPSQTNNFEVESKESIKPMKSVTGNGKSDFKVINKVDMNVLRKTVSFEEPREGDMKSSGLKLHSKTDLSASKIKALAKISSGGFDENDISVSISKTHDSPEADKEYNVRHSYSSRIEGVSDTRLPVYPVRTVDIASSVDPSQPVIPHFSNPESSNSIQRAVTSGIVNRQNQTLDKKVRPLTLHPVVKGFRVPTEMPSSSPSSPNTKDIRTFPSNNKTNSSSYDKKPMYHRGFSTPEFSPIVREATKERNNNKVFPPPLSVTAKTKTKPVDTTPPSPPVMPVLKPVGDRKNIKLLPPPEAKPRDQLMLSIRSFTVDSLRKVTK